MRNLFVLSLAAMAASSAFATYCPDGSTIESHPGGICVSNMPTSSSDAKAQAGAVAGSVSSVGNISNRQQQAQQQGQAQGQSLNNRNSSVSGGGSAVGVGGSGGSVVVNGNAEGSGDRSSFVAWAPIIHGPAAPALASGNLVVVPGVCGPRVRVVTTQVVGQHYGAMGGESQSNNGYTETLAPYLDEYGYPTAPFVQVGPYLMGHLVTQYVAILGTSSAASFSLGGFVDAKGLQGGAAGSGSRQQLVKGIQVQDCVMPVERPVVVAPPVVVPVAQPVRKPRPRPVRRSVPACNPVPMLCVPAK